MRKTVTLPVVALLFVMGCTKGENNLKLELSSKEVLLGEPVVAWVTGYIPKTRFVWDMQYFRANFIEKRDDKAALAFTWEGKYEVRVRLSVAPDSSIYAVLSDTVVVRDSIFTMPKENTTEAPAGDELYLTPVFAADSTLVFMAQTKKKFGCVNTYLESRSNDNTTNIIDLEFKSVWVPDAPTCIEGEAPARGIVFTNRFVTDGEHPISVKFNNTEYKGILKTSGHMSRFEFIWTHTAVQFSPMVIAR